MNDAVRGEREAPGPDLLARPGRGAGEARCALSRDLRSSAAFGLFVLAALYTLHIARALIIPVVLAIMLSLVLAPAVRYLKRVGIAEPIGSAAVLMVLLAGLATGVYRFAAPAAAWLSEEPPRLLQPDPRLPGLAAEALRTVAQRLTAVLGIYQESPPLNGGEFDAALQLGGVVFGVTFSFVAGLLVMFVLLYVLLASGDLSRRKLVKLLPTLAEKKRAIRIARRTEKQISSYLFTITCINVGLGVAVGAAMYLLGMPTPFLWGTMAGLLNFAPFAGSMVSALVLLAVASVTFDSIEKLILVPLVYIALTTIEAYLVTPTILGKRFRLNVIAVFLSLFFWGWMWGPAGVLLAVPMLATLKIISDQVDRLAPLGELLGR
jgi:predicted PurR-regulated permease PerM